jgi:hypothetical protein
MSDVNALLEERRGYVLRGLKDRVTQVDVALEAFGVKVDDAPVETTAAAPQENARRGPGRPRKIAD